MTWAILELEHPCEYDVIQLLRTYEAERNKPSYRGYRSLSLSRSGSFRVGVCSTNTYDGIRFESEFGHVKAEIHFEKPLLCIL